MSSLPPSNPNLPEVASTEAQRARRGASVTLRKDADRGMPSDMMDPANRSLAEALRIAYRLLQVSIVIMALVYLLSGMQTIGTAETGVRVTLGRDEPEVLAPGLHLAWPEPIGKIERVITSDQVIELRDKRRGFFPNLSPEEEKILADPNQREQGLKNGGIDALDPDQDGMLLTADGSIAHTRWRATYVRSKDAQSLRAFSVDADSPQGRSTEEQVVTAAIRRGVIHAAAGLTVDELLYDQPDPSRGGAFKSVQQTAKEKAQEVLDRLKSGITITALTRTDRMPPRRVMEAFNEVQSSQSKAKKAVEEAESEARQTRAKAAGQASALLIAKIDEYERSLSDADKSKPAKVLAEIHQVLRSRGATLPNGATVQVAGTASQIISEALDYRTSVVTRAASSAATFKAKREAYQSNPEVFLAREWSEAFRTFVTRSEVETLYMPRGMEKLVVRINRDPVLAKEIEQNAANKAAEAAQKAREDKRKREIFERRSTGDEGGG